MSTDSSPEPPPLLSAQTLSGHWNVSSIVPVQQNVGERRGSIHQEPRRSQTVRALSNQQNTVSRDESLDTTLESTLPLRLQTPNGQQSTSPTPAASTSRSGNTQQASGERPGTLFSRMIGRHRQAGLIPLRDEIEVEVETEPANRRSQALDRIDNECRIRDEQEIQNWAQGLRSIRYSNAPITSDQRQWILRTELLWLRLIYAALRLRSRQSANILLEYESLYDIWYALKDYHLANSAAEGVLILETQVLGPWRNLMDHLDHADEIGIGDDELDCMCHELSDDRPWMFHYQYQLTWKSLRGNRY
ncbi:MAG: hypothetical protein L6R41_001171 [Letrouitia leprolyta]|nr:MAG: hypothetical protein L6R41_001171 [Letrouitia leprolyta]